MVRLCHESRIARAFGITLALMYERIRYNQELNGGEPWGCTNIELAEDLSLNERQVRRIAEKLESLAVNGQPVLIRKRGRHQVLWQVTANEQEMIHLSNRTIGKEMPILLDDILDKNNGQNVHSNDDNNGQNVHSELNNGQNVHSNDDNNGQNVHSGNYLERTQLCPFLNEPLIGTPVKQSLDEFKEEEEISTNVDTKKNKKDSAESKKRFKRKVAQPAPSQLNLASVESICEEAIRRTKLPADHDEHQASNSIPIESFDWLDRDIWRDYHAKRNNLKSNWTYNAAKLTLIELSKAKEQTFKQQPPLTADEIHDYLNYFNSRATGQAPKVSFMFQHCRGNQFFQHSKPTLEDTLKARKDKSAFEALGDRMGWTDSEQSNPIKDITPKQKAIGHD